LTEPRALRLRDVHFSYGGPEVLAGIDLEVDAGELVAVLGPNGAGKTTLVRIATGGLAPSRGSVSLFGNPLGELPRRERARRVAVVPQESRAVFDFTVREIVRMGRAPHLGLLGIEGPADRDAAEEAMRETDLLELADHRMAELSGGEKQRVLIARALAQGSPLLLLDEPTAYLDIRHRLEVYRLARDLRASRGLTVLSVSHDINLAARFCPRVVLLHRGRVLADGPASEVITSGSLREVYGTEVRVLPDPDRGNPVVLP
jgi:iron complex transport system ATP-binding protein